MIRNMNEIFRGNPENLKESIKRIEFKEGLEGIHHFTENEAEELAEVVFVLFFIV